MIAFINRFHGHGSLRYVYQNSQSFRSQLINIKMIKNPHRKNSRIAVVISKKTLKSSVGRNRIRRRVYEYIRSQIPLFTGIFDIVIIVSSGELTILPYNEITTNISQILIQAGIVKK